MPEYRRKSALLSLTYVSNIRIVWCEILRSPLRAWDSKSGQR